MGNRRIPLRTIFRGYCLPLSRRKVADVEKNRGNEPHIRHHGHATSPHVHPYHASGHFREHHRSGAMILRFSRIYARNQKNQKNQFSTAICGKEAYLRSKCTCSIFHNKFIFLSTRVKKYSFRSLNSIKKPNRKTNSISNRNFPLVVPKSHTVFQLHI